MRDYYEMLRRTAAILLSLAALAEWVADRSRPVRWLVLWVLQRAEAVASAYVAETDPLAIAYPALQPADGHDEAVRLAETFRMLAAMVLALAHQAQLLAIREPSEQPCPAWLTGSRECRPASARTRRAATALRRHILNWTRLARASHSRPPSGWHRSADVPSAPRVR